MEYVRLGRTGVQVSEICLGAMTFGNEADETVSRALMDRAFDMGVNFFDSAYNYNLGETERILGRWLGKRRHDIFLTSKVFFPGGGGRNDQGLSRWNLRFAVEESLRRLQTDYIDLLYLHHWDEHVDIEQTLGAAQLLVEQGKIVYLGVSNFSAWQAMKTLAAAEKGGFPAIVCMQPMYNLVKRQAEVELLPLAAHTGMAVAPYSPMGAGLLSGKYLEGGTGRLHDTEMYRQRYANPVYADVARKFVAYAREHGYSPAALAVAWTRTHPQVTAPIVGARSLEQWDEAMRCLDIRLTPEQRLEISALSVEPPSATDREPMEVFRKRGW